MCNASTARRTAQQWIDIRRTALLSPEQPHKHTSLTSGAGSEAAGLHMFTSGIVDMFQKLHRLTLIP